MSYLVTKYPHGTFSWANFSSTNITTTTQFLTALFNWTSESGPLSSNKSEATMFQLEGHYTAGSNVTESNTSFCSSYVTVDDIEKLITKAKELGAEIVVPVTDVSVLGQTATIQDPTGAKISLWQPKEHIGAGIVNTLNAMCWNELYTNDIEKAKEFYSTLLGWTFEEETEPGYTTIRNNSRMNGGILPLAEDEKGTEAYWLAEFTVEDIDQTIKRVLELGGHVHFGPATRTYGPEIIKIAVVSDPTGARFAIQEMSEPGADWKE